MTIEIFTLTAILALIGCFIAITSFIWKILNKIRDEMNLGFARADEKTEKLRDEMNLGFARADEKIEKLRDEMNLGFARADEKIEKLRDEMNLGFARVDEKIEKLRDEMNLGFARADEKTEKLRDEVNHGSDKLRDEFRQNQDKTDNRFGQIESANTEIRERVTAVETQHDLLNLLIKPDSARNLSTAAKDVTIGGIKRAVPAGLEQTERTVTLQAAIVETLDEKTWRTTKEVVELLNEREPHLVEWKLPVTEGQVMQIIEKPVNSRLFERDGDGVRLKVRSLESE